MRVVLYARVSTLRQAERDLSVPDQLRQLREYCRQHGHEIVREFREEGASATDDNRPAFRQMIRFVVDKDSRVEAILVLTTSRFFRDALGAKVYKRRLKREGIRVVSITQEVSDDPTGNFIEGIFELQDQYESDINAYHTLRGMKENARRGYFNGSKPPFGYRVETIQDERGNLKGRLVPDEREAAIVRRMFDLYVNGLDGRRVGVKQLAEILNQEGRLYRKGHKWSKQRVQNRLCDPVYIGEYYFNKKDGRTGKCKPREEWIPVPVEPIIDRELFEKAKRVREHYRPSAELPPSVAGSPLLLTGLLRCGKCGARMTLETGKGGAYRYYNCSNYLRRGKSSCPGNRVPQRELEQQILEHLADKLFTIERIRGLVRQLAAELAKFRRRNSEKIRPLRRQLDDVRARIKRHYEAIEAGAVDLHLVGERIRELKQEEADLAARLEQVDRPKQIPPYLFKTENLQKIQANLRQIFLSDQHGLAKRYLNLLLRRIEIEGDEVRLQGDTSALCALGMAPDDKGTVHHKVPVPPVDLSWLRGEDSNLQPSG